MNTNLPTAVEMRTKEPYQPVILEHDETYLSIEFSPDGMFLVVFSDGHTTAYGQENAPTVYVRTAALAIVWEIEAWTKQARCEGGHHGNISFHPSGRLFAFANQLWDTATGQVVKKIDTATLLSFSPDGKMLVGLATDEQQDSGSDSDEEPSWDCLLLDSQTGEPLRRLTRKNDERETIALGFVQGGARVVALGYEYDRSDRSYFWDAQSGRQLPTFDKVDAVTDGFEVHLLVSPSGRYVITTNGEVQVWEMEEVSETPSNPWRYRHTCRGHARGVWEASFSNDERLLVTMGAETLDYEGEEAVTFSVRVWNVASGQEQAKFAMAGKCYCCEFSPDSRLVAAMSAETESYFKDEAEFYTLTLWDVASRRMLTQRTTVSKKTNLLYHYPTGLVFSPDGRWLAVSHLKHVEVWDMHALLET